MNELYNEKLKGNAQTLRKNMTKQERHFDDDALAADVQRDAYLRSLGISVLRIPNNAVCENFRGVCEEISRHLMTPEGKEK